jgi:hypothetical protein
MAENNNNTPTTVLTIFSSVAITLLILWGWAKYHKPSANSTSTVLLKAVPITPITFLDNVTPTYNYTIGDTDSEIILQCIPWSGNGTNPNAGIDRYINLIFPSIVTSPNASLFNGRVVNVTNLGFGEDIISVNNVPETSNGENIHNVNTAQSNYTPGELDDSQTAINIYVNGLNSWTFVYSAADDTWNAFCRNNNYQPIPNS